MLIALLALLTVSSPLLWLLRPHRWRHAGWLAAIPPALVTAWLITQLAPVGQGVFVTEQVTWSDAFGLNLQLRLDGLALLFGLIIAGIGACIAIYAGYYFEDDPKLGYFYALLFLFMPSMLGLVWADNLLALFVFWEGTSITSYLLISFKLADKAALEGARRALVVTGMGALAMLGGLVLLGQMAGDYTISGILAQAPAALMANPLFPAALVLILLGAFTKSAQFPFHFWLPGAMSAPTPASAYLHSATMVKAGVYLLARMHPALSEHPLWFWALFVIGGVTMLLGASSALRYYDLKAILAHATVSQLGVLVMLLAFTSEKAAVAVVLGILAHALYKGPLFLIAGIIDHATGTRDIRQLAGLGRKLPLVAATVVLAGISMAGLLPTFGFVAKETALENFYGYVTEGDLILGWVGLVATALGGAFFVAYSLTLIWEPFFRRRASLEAVDVHHKPRVLFVAPALVLTLIGSMIPFLLGVLEHDLFAPPAAAIVGAPVDVHLLLWHGFTPVLYTSLVAIGVGVVIFLLREPVRAAFARTPAWLNGQFVFDQSVDALYALANWSTRTVQGASFATQLSVTFLAASAFVVYALLGAGLIGDLRNDWGALPTFYEVVLSLLAISAALVTARLRNRLSAIISIGVVGVVMTLIFVFFGAPDLALTQLLIELLTVVMLVLVFYRIPPRDHPSMSRPMRIRNWVVACAVGLWGGVMALLGAESPLRPAISEFFLLNAVPAAHGGNIVNVILVDFRAFDTFGEITVLVIAAVGGYALLRAWRLRPARAAEPLDETMASAAQSVSSSSPNVEETSHA